MSTSDASGDEAADFDLDWLDEDDADEGAAATSGSTAALEGSLAGGGAQRGAGEGDAGDGTRRGQPSQAEDPEVAALLRAVPDLTMAEQRRAADLVRLDLDSSKSLAVVSHHSTAGVEGLIHADALP